eukprot:COSAG02_NODE_392_length_23227_cov_30.763620_20_plen_110_part_00
MPLVRLLGESGLDVSLPPNSSAASTDATTDSPLPIASTTHHSFAKYVRVLSTPAPAQRSIITQTRGLGYDTPNGPVWGQGGVILRHGCVETACNGPSMKINGICVNLHN